MEQGLTVETRLTRRSTRPITSASATFVTTTINTSPLLNRTLTLADALQLVQSPLTSHASGLGLEHEHDHEHKHQQGLSLSLSLSPSTSSLPQPEDLPRRKRGRPPKIKLYVHDNGNGKGGERDIDTDTGDMNKHGHTHDPTRNAADTSSYPTFPTSPADPRIKSESSTSAAFLQPQSNAIGNGNYPSIGSGGVNLSDLATAALSESESGGMHGLLGLAAASSQVEQEEAEADAEAEAAAGTGSDGGGGGGGGGSSMSPEMVKHASIRPSGSRKAGAGGGQGHSGSPVVSAASKRREANRLAAARFRTRKKDQVVELEARVITLEAENQDLKKEVKKLRELIPDGGASVPATVIAPRPPPGLFSHSGDEGEGAVARSQSPLSASLIAAAVAAANAANTNADLSMSDLENLGAGSTPTNAGKKRRKVAGQETTADQNVSLENQTSATIEMEEQNRHLHERLRNYEATLQAMNQEINGLRNRMIDPALMGGDRLPVGGRGFGLHIDPVLMGSNESAGDTPRGGPRREMGTELSRTMSAQTYPLPFGNSNNNNYAYDDLKPGSHASLPLPVRGQELERKSSNLSLSIPPLSPALRLDSGTPQMPMHSPTLVHSTPSFSHLTHPRQPTPVSSARGTPTASPRPSSPLTLGATGRAGSYNLSRQGSWPGNSGADTPGGTSKTGWNFPRGLDSPVSAERSGIGGDDDEEENDYFDRRMSIGSHSTSDERHREPGVTGVTRQARTLVDLSNNAGNGSDSSDPTAGEKQQPKDDEGDDRMEES